ncbi:MAG: CDGSH iron-sulfur domain-containing protein [Saprospiraceae bacterium]|nr:CDGSH iron-sulfur domain-containing protein [Saprospiraceae bacterium]MBK6565218.1 CDGSH iron-sulfur domain-containing protein [Saprospiraceae bacterium]MBK6785864.1 CDGSH iron-sulfur domain-containing protein [Saprospiraceae bacterium]MBK7525648.1 CDGSH iron-sulfur domain-containing protein [Saprospiraceae bacterium]MBK8080271.1 CDGSH iron-sulfur domain-containing protein [Saprospiraceae bacterium]
MMSTKITILPNGSARIEGEFTIVDSEGKEFGLAGRTTVSLCRCGLSKNKPFCDGAHKENFDAETKAFDLPPKKV